MDNALEKLYQVVLARKGEKHGRLVHLLFVSAGSR